MQIFNTCRESIWATAVVVLVAIVAVVYADNQNTASSAGDANDLQSAQQEVRSFIAAYPRTLEAQNEEAIRKLYVDDGRFLWITDGRKLYSSVDQLLKSIRSYKSQGIQFRTRLSDVDVMRLSPGLSFVSTVFETKGLMNEKRAFQFSGIVTMVLEKDDVSGWRILRGHTSTPGGPPSDKESYKVRGDADGD